MKVEPTGGEWALGRAVGHGREACLGGARGVHGVLLSADRTTVWWTTGLDGVLELEGTRWDGSWKKWVRATGCCTTQPPSPRPSPVRRERESEGMRGVGCDLDSYGTPRAFGLPTLGGVTEVPSPVGRERVRVRAVGAQRGVNVDGRGSRREDGMEDIWTFDSYGDRRERGGGTTNDGKRMTVDVTGREWALGRAVGHGREACLGRARGVHGVLLSADRTTVWWTTGLDGVLEVEGSRWDGSWRKWVWAGGCWTTQPPSPRPSPIGWERGSEGTREVGCGLGLDGTRRALGLPALTRVTEVPSPVRLRPEATGGQVGRAFARRSGYGPRRRERVRVRAVGAERGVDVNGRGSRSGCYGAGSRGWTNPATARSEAEGWGTTRRG
jgi:hypothetical protein